MARKQVVNTLPPLQEIFETFPGFIETDSKQQVLTDALRAVARRFRAQKSRSFFTMRDVAAFFSVPLRTVAITYERLEREGLLTRIRGSKTLLTGKDVTLASPVRAVVGIPLWLHAIVVSPFSRHLHVELEERLRAHGFVADIIFFREEEVISPDFAERLLLHNLDIVIWHTPHPLATQTLLRMSDRGVRQILVVPSDNPASINLPTYIQDWQNAYTALAKAWHGKGIRNVIIPETMYLPSKRAMNNCMTTLQSSGLKTQMVKCSAKTIREEVHRRGAKSSGVAFLDQVGADEVCNEEPVILEEIMHMSRIAFCRGRIRVPYFNHRKGVADFVAFSPGEIAERLVNDLQLNSSVRQNPIPRFYAKYHDALPFHSQEDHL